MRGSDPSALSSTRRGPWLGRSRGLTVTLRFDDVILVVSTIVAHEVTLVGEHISVPSGVLSTNWLKFPRTIAVTLNQSG